ncbi:hypothetical protein L1274_000211 [Duganella sp. HSC-15S17]|uniref:GNAT family N-acetyltransferase n=1 Tax=Duganella violaceipulchra TaxID=2849652 RepID=A0ABT1GCU1_9BURK|nr:hypothetical protein [Duganella violaceicalia]
MKTTAGKLVDVKRVDDRDGEHLLALSRKVRD